MNGCQLLTIIMTWCRKNQMFATIFWILQTFGAKSCVFERNYLKKPKHPGYFKITPNLVWKYETRPDLYHMSKRIHTYFQKTTSHRLKHGGDRVMLRGYCSLDGPVVADKVWHFEILDRMDTKPAGVQVYICFWVQSLDYYVKKKCKVVEFESNIVMGICRLSYYSVLYLTCLLDHVHH